MEREGSPDLKGAPRLARSTTAAEVARIVRQRILSGQYKAGDFLRQEALAQELGVSRIPIREALALLEAEGFVVREQYRGALIPHLSLREVEEIYKLRSMLEPFLLEQAIPKLTPAVIAKARELVVASRTCSDLNEWGRLNFQFHKTLYAVADLPLTMQVLDQLLMRADRYLRMQRYLSAEIQQESDQEHLNLLDLLEAGRNEEAIAALRSHISWNETDVRSTYEAALSGAARS
ncbi:GntR family transcriptional regulator [Steroidobacter cummioxidans]|uniref:GntR family transcriptional regulator n=1 Tax=Steroidobacter cummioxidans TaxID=1803913 RepID=UPI000E314238|nr:GntR family transcriptional regulator [Steroidobacter cummioxidans]